MTTKKPLPQPPFSELMKKVNQHLMPAYVKQLQSTPKPTHKPAS